MNFKLQDLATFLHAANQKGDAGRRKNSWGGTPVYQASYLGGLVDQERA